MTSVVAVGSGVAGAGVGSPLADSPSPLPPPLFNGATTATCVAVGAATGGVAADSGLRTSGEQDRRRQNE
ncbi:MAG: hypothetical protein M9930_13350 [Anaerolineae bacterium]|nr:hypothetical protein [Anaerolineae bacterium]